VQVTGDGLCERVDYTDKGSLHLLIGQAEGAQQGTVRRALYATSHSIASHLPAPFLHQVLDKKRLCSRKIIRVRKGIIASQSNLGPSGRDVESVRASSCLSAYIKKSLLVGEALRACTFFCLSGPNSAPNHIQLLHKKELYKNEANDDDRVENQALIEHLYST
jgi:hypothetical protein